MLRVRGGRRGQAVGLLDERSGRVFEGVLVAGVLAPGAVVGKQLGDALCVPAEGRVREEPGCEADGLVMVVTSLSRLPAASRRCTSVSTGEEAALLRVIIVQADGSVTVMSLAGGGVTIGSGSCTGAEPD